MSKPAESQPEQSPSSTEGQVSEVGAFGTPGEQISPEDSVAGAPEGESGHTDEGPTGPDAVTNDSRQDHHPHKRDVETTG